MGRSEIGKRNKVIMHSGYFHSGILALVQYNSP